MSTKNLQNYNNWKMEREKESQKRNYVTCNTFIRLITLREA